MSRWTHIMQWSITLTLATWGLWSSPLANAQVPVRSLREAESRLARPFDRITGLHELRDARVIVVDANEQSVLLVDFARNSSVQLGRNGSGPGEYKFPFRLLRLGGDTVGIEDGGNQRIVVLTGQGKFGGTLNSTGMRIGSPAPAHGESPRTSDGQGRLYAEGFSQASDSAPIVRWRVGSSICDTVAFLPLPPIEFRRTLPGEGTRAFVAAPEWAVGLDGQVAILHVTSYSVNQINSKGVRTKGKPIPYQRIRVTEAHKRQWREEQDRPVPVTIMTPGGVVSAGLRTIACRSRSNGRSTCRHT